ncbi:MAG: MMPL family transporter [Candidatus Aminicenantes bacterium]|nr:MMPL family transporter [Candidatus Aminicenantes bacterium]
MRERFLKKMADWHVAFPWRMLIIFIIITFVFGFLAANIKVTMRWSDLLPSKDKRTVQFNKIIDEFVSATSLVVVVQGPEDRIKAYADLIATQILKLVDVPTGTEHMKLFRRVDYKTEIEFLKKHGLMLIKEDNLKNSKEVFTDPNLKGFLFNLNRSLEKEYVGKKESISTRENEDQAVVFLDGIQTLASTLLSISKGEAISETEIRKAADKFLFGEPYFLSYDKKALILNVIPNFTMMDLDLLVTGTDAVQEIINKMENQFPDIKAGLTGFIAVGRDEMVYSQKSLGYTTLIALIAILVLLIVSFRMWVAPILAIVNLLMGLIWAIGATALVVEQLNIMTQMLAVILIGLGIDFSIHLISSFTEKRSKGGSVSEAMHHAFLKSGKGIITGGLTTACAFYTMTISQSQGMREMGLVAGTGLLAVLLCTLLFLPILLVFRERISEHRLTRKKHPPKTKSRDISFGFLGKIADWLSRKYVFTLLAALVLSIFFILAASGITFDHNYLNIEPKGLTSINLYDTVLDKFDMSMDYAMVLTNSPEESYRIAREYRKIGTVAITEDISLYLPTPEQQKKRTAYIQEIHESIKASPINNMIRLEDMSAIFSEIKRLEMNIIEIQDMAFIGGQDKVDTKCKSIVGDPDNPQSGSIFKELLSILETNQTHIRDELSNFQRLFAPYLKESILNMASTQPIGINDLPPSILDRYCNKERNRFLVTIFPAESVWQDAEYLDRFADDLKRVSENTTGMPLIFRALVEVIGRDGGNAALLTLLVVFLLLWIDFRNPAHALMAMIPLAFGIVWMIGLMRLTGMQLTVMNVMGLPMILGIGIDDGVHIVHRWKLEGKTRLNVVFASTGKAILLTSLTTMLGFGSLVFSIWPGFGHLGGALFLGVGACFLTTVLFLSGIIGFIERKYRLPLKQKS